MRGALAPSLCGAVLAACCAAPPERAPDPQAAYEPTSAPGDGQAFLARMQGTFRVEKTFHPRTGAPVVSHGTCEQSMIEDGRFLESDFTFVGEGTTTTGKGIIGFDPATGRFTSFWIDARSTRVSIRQSREPFDGTRLVLHAAALGSEAPARPSRTETVLVDGGGTIEHRHYALSSEGGERLMMELRMRRTAASDGPAPR